MLVLGNIDTEKAKNNFLKKFEEFRRDADEYTFGTIKSERLEATVYHKPCGKTFVARPYSLIRKDGVRPKHCPYCYE